MLSHSGSSALTSGLGASYREGVALGQLRYMRCLECNTPQTLARYACQQCGSAELDWVNSALLGEVYALTVVTRAPSEEFRALAPYTLVLVDLQEGPRLMGHGEPGLVIGDPVVASFVDLGGKRLVLFRRFSKMPNV